VNDAVAAIDRIVPALAVDRVVARAAGNGVVARAGVDDVVALQPGNIVGSVLAEKNVVARRPHNHRHTHPH
jgi:hypothetical protein